MKTIITLLASLTLSLTLNLTLATTSAIADEGWTALFDGKTLHGWTQINGTAPYTAEDDAIVGTAVVGSPNSFLATKESYSDFILEFEVWGDSPLNSGVQFRSQQKSATENGRVFGYQMEIDPSNRRWTGGIYDEARRGWIYPLTRNKKGRAAYKKDAWNSFRIEAVGPVIRVWVNGIPTANLVDDVTKSGFIALQVHDIGNDQAMVGKKVRWRNIRIKTDGLQAAMWHMPDAVPEFNYLANTLTPRQVAEGWTLLFDGKTSTGWRSAKSATFPEKGWEIKDGVLTVLSSGGYESRNGGDIITTKEFSNFELEVDFNLSPGANSGIKYFVDPNLLKGEGSAIGLEFQLLDDKKHPDAKKGVKGNRTISSLYDLITAGNLSEQHRDTKRFNGIGVWNRARIVVRGSEVEHWLNNVLTVKYNRHSQIFRALVAYSKYKNWPNFGEWKQGPILLQDHGDLVSFRSIKIRELDQ